MRFSKFFQYAYLIFAVLFIYDGVSKWGNGTNSAYLSFGIGALAIFMYFFKRKFAKKIENNNTK